jgi:hypothetical protein
MLSPTVTSVVSEQSNRAVGELAKAVVADADVTADAEVKAAVDVRR